MVESPVIAPGCVMAAELSAKDKLTGEVLAHALLAETTIVPLTALQEKSAPVAGVPCPDEIVAPLGTDQVYVVAPVIGTIEYGVDIWPSKGDVVPVITPSDARLDVIVIAREAFVLPLSQELLAFTVIFPDTAVHK